MHRLMQRKVSSSTTHEPREQEDFIIPARLLFEKIHITQKTSREKEVFCCVKGEFFRNDLFVKSIRITIKIILLPNIIIYKYFA